MAGKIVRTDIIERMSNKIYASDSILTDSIMRDVDHSLCESLGISREVEKESQRNFETEMSSYTWATNDVYKLAKKLLNDKNEYVYLIGVILYMSFKQEQEGYANGLYAFLKNCGQKVTRKNIDELSEAEESFSMLRLLKMSKNYLLGIPAKSQEMIDAIDVVNLSYGTKYTAENLYGMANNIYKDFMRRLNRVKSLILFPKEMYEANIKRLLDAAPFLVKNGKIISG